MSPLSTADWEAFSLSLQVAGLSTLLLLILATPLAWWLSQSRGRGRVLLQAFIALPLVLPPTVLGFYLLVLMHPEGALSGLLRSLGWQGQLSFSFSGLVLGSLVYSAPFAVQPLMHAFGTIPRNLLDAASTLRAGPWDRFFHLVLPLSRRGFIVAATLSFAHTLGEFGVVLMLGGNIPGETRTAAIAIYDHVESLQYAQAHAMSVLMLLFSLLLLLPVYAAQRGTDPLRLR